MAVVMGKPENDRENALVGLIAQLRLDNIARDYFASRNRTLPLDALEEIRSRIAGAIDHAIEREVEQIEEDLAP